MATGGTVTDDTVYPPEDNDETTYSPVMPFTCVTSKGGPYDDDAFTAGFAMGQLWETLADRSVIHAATIRSSCEEQADLIAMHHGYNVVVLGRVDEWVMVEFMRPDADEPLAAT